MESPQLKPGEFYFELNGKQTFLLGRNPTGRNVQQFEPLLKWAGESGEKIVRVHVTNGIRPKAAAGEIDEAWARQWETVFDTADRNGLYVLPVLAVWADWNDGSQGEKWHNWPLNPYNAARNGPALSPDELFHATRCQELWLQWLKKIVARWQTRPNIFAWEIFSELNLLTGASEPDAVEFVERAAKIIRAADPQSRPITASLAGAKDWPQLSRSNAIDFLQIHPYANGPRFQGNLDDMILTTVRNRLKQYHRPVFIGECGLDARGAREELDLSPGASIGARNAIWASAVSGAMNGRMLWWEDGYDQYSGIDLRTEYKAASAAAARFVEGVDFGGFKPLEAAMSPDLRGAALGNAERVLGWVRDARCTAPDWPVRRVEGETVTVHAPGAAAAWRVEFHDTASGDPVSNTAAQCEGGKIAVPLPAFEGSIAFKMSPVRAKT